MDQPILLKGGKSVFLIEALNNGIPYPKCVCVVGGQL